MGQIDLFGGDNEKVYLPYALAEYHSGFFTENESSFFLKKFIAETPWEQRVLKIYNKELLTPRLTAWYGEPGTDYSFSGTKNNPLPWTEEMLQIKQRIELVAGVAYK